MDDPAEDVENECVLRQRIRDNQLSSILKSNRLSEIDINTKIETHVTKRMSRRVSFAETYVVKEFLTESPQAWNSEPDDNIIESDDANRSNNGSQKDCEIPNITDFDKLLTGTIQSKTSDGSDVNVDRTPSNHEEVPPSCINITVPQFDRTADMDMFVHSNNSVFMNSEPETHEQIDSQSYLSQFSKTKSFASTALKTPASDMRLTDMTSDDLHSKIDSKSFIEKLTRSMTRSNKAETHGYPGKQLGGNRSKDDTNRSNNRTADMDMFVHSNNSVFMNSEPETHEQIDSQSFLPQFSKTKSFVSTALKTPASDMRMMDMTSDDLHSKIDSKSFIERLKFMTRSKKAETQRYSDLLVTNPEPTTSSLIIPGKQLGENRSKGLSDITMYFENDVTATMTQCPNLLDLNKSLFVDNEGQGINLDKSDVGPANTGHYKLIGKTTGPEIAGKISGQSKLGEYSVTGVSATKMESVFDSTQIFGPTDKDASMDMTCENIADKSDIFPNINNTAVMDMTCQAAPETKTKLVLKKMSANTSSGNVKILGSSEDTAVMEMTCHNKESAVVESGHTIIFGKENDAAAMETTCEVIPDLRNKSAALDANRTKLFGKENDAAAMEMTCELIPDLRNKSAALDTNRTKVFGKENDAAAMEMTCEVIPDRRNKSAVIESGHTIIFGNGIDTASMEMTCEHITDRRNKSSLAEANHTKVFGNHIAAMEMTCEVIPDLRNKSTLSEANRTKVFGNDTGAMQMTCEVIPDLRNKSTLAEANHTKVFGNDTGAMEMTCEVIPDLRNKSAALDTNHTKVFGNDTAAMEMTCEVIPDLRNKSAALDTNRTKVFGKENDAAAMEMTCELIPDRRNKSAVIESGHTIIFGNGKDMAALEMTCEHITDRRNKSTLAEANRTNVFGNDTAAMEMTCEHITDRRNKSTLAEANHTKVFGNDTAAMEMTCEVITDRRNKSTLAEANRTKVFGNDTAAMEMTCELIPDLRNKSTLAEANSTKVFGNDTAAMEMTCELIPDLRNKSTLAEANSTKVFGNDTGAMEMTCELIPDRRNKSAVIESGHTIIFGSGKDSAAMEMTCELTPDVRNKPAALEAFSKNTGVNASGLKDQHEVKDNDCTQANRQVEDKATVKITCDKFPDSKEKSADVNTDHTRIFGSTEVSSAMEMTCQNTLEFKLGASAVDGDRTRVFGSNNSTAVMEAPHDEATNENTLHQLSTLSQEQSDPDPLLKIKAQDSVSPSEARPSCTVFSNIQSVSDPVSLGNRLKRKLYAFDMMMAGAKAKSIPLLNRDSPTKTEIHTINSANVINCQNSLSTTTMKDDVEIDEKISNKKRNTGSIAVPVKTDILPITVEEENTHYLSNKDAVKPKQDPHNYSHITRSDPYKLNVEATVSSFGFEDTTKTNITLSLLKSMLNMKADRTMTTLITPSPEKDEHLDLPVNISSVSDTKTLAMNRTSDDSSLKVNTTLNTTCSKDQTNQYETFLSTSDDRSSNYTQQSINQSQLNQSAYSSSMCPILERFCRKMDIENKEWIKIRYSNFMMEVACNQAIFLCFGSKIQIHHSKVYGISMVRYLLQCSKTSVTLERYLACSALTVEYEEFIHYTPHNIMSHENLLLSNSNSKSGLPAEICFRKLEADTMQDVLKIQTMKVPKYEINARVLADVKLQNEKLQLEIDNIHAKMNETPPVVFDIIEKADPNSTEFEELKDKVHSCKSFCLKKARLMWKRRQTDRNTDYIMALQDQELKFSTMLNELLCQIETVCQQESAEEDDEIEQLENSRVDDEEKCAEYQQVVQKEKELEKCLKENEEILREKKALEEKTLALDHEHSRLIDELINPPDSKKKEQEEILTQLKGQLNILKRYRRWELKEQSPTHFVFLFFYNALELTVMFEAGHLKTTKSISLVSYLEDESSPLVKLAVKLILEATDTTKLKEEFRTRDALPQLLHEVSCIVGNIHTMADEIDRVSVWNTVDIKEKLVTISVISVAMIRKVSLSFTMSRMGYPLDISHYEIKVIIGNIKAEQIRKHLETVTHGYDYCERLVKAIKDYIQL